MTFAAAINDALHVAMKIDSSMLCYGLGVDDPRRIFGTTKGLVETFGADRVFDMPTAENAMTGVAIGAALNGIRSVMVHQRNDFFLLAMDQLVNSAAKWHYLFGKDNCVPITIRLIVGRGWGNGPTHSQSLQSWFAHVPGLKVVMPATAKDAKGLLLSSLFDNNPVIFMEHRWLHETLSEVPEGDCRIPLGEANCLLSGDDITVVSMSQMTIEAVKAARVLSQYDVNIDLIDLRTVKPIDWHTIKTSVKKTGKLLVLDTSWEMCSIAGEIVARISTDCFDWLITAPQRLCLPDISVPTSIALTEGFYKEAKDIVTVAGAMLSKSIDCSDHILVSSLSHDVPDASFVGPF